MTPAAEEALRTLERELTEHEHGVCEDCREEMERLENRVAYVCAARDENLRLLHEARSEYAKKDAELRDTRKLLAQARKAREASAASEERMRRDLDKALVEAEDLSEALGEMREEVASLRASRDRVADAGVRMGHAVDVASIPLLDELRERLERLEALMGEAS